MPFHFRKSVSAGPFRFNFSSGGVGMSVGVKGLRIGTGPRGHYVQAGRDGFYYRASIGRPSQRGNIRPTQAPGARPPTTSWRSDGMIEITSSDVLAMRDVAFADFLSELNAKHQQMKISLVMGGIAAFIGIAITLASQGLMLLPAILATVLAWAIGAWLDSYKRAAVLFYDLEPFAESRFTEICAAFDGLASCAQAWHIQAGKAVRDLTTWKRQAGASHLVRRTPTTLSYALPTVLKCNVTPPALNVGKRTIYLLPDMALVHDTTGFGAVGYDALRLAIQTSNFIEDGQVPRDAEISHHTWQHPNKNGGPDRRFRSNRRLPVCKYEVVHLTSANGVNELLEFSRRGLSERLARGLSAMPRNAGMANDRLISPT